MHSFGSRKSLVFGDTHDNDSGREDKEKSYCSIRFTRREQCEQMCILRVAFRALQRGDHTNEMQRKLRRSLCSQSLLVLYLTRLQGPKHLLCVRYCTKCSIGMTTFSL